MLSFEKPQKRNVNQAHFVDWFEANKLGYKVSPEGGSLGYAANGCNSVKVVAIPIENKSSYYKKKQSNNNCGGHLQEKNGGIFCLGISSFSGNNVNIISYLARCRSVRQIWCLPNQTGNSWSVNSF